MKRTGFLLLLSALILPRPHAAWGQAQTAGAAFGEVVGLGGTPSDAVLDELRGRIYLVNDRANRVEIYGIPEKRVVGSIQVGNRPLAAAMSMEDRKSVV